MFSPRAMTTYASAVTQWSTNGLAGSNSSGSITSSASPTRARAHPIRLSPRTRPRSVLPESCTLRAVLARPVTRSARLARLLAEQALRAEDHDQHEVGEHDRRRPRAAAHPVVGDLLDAADDQAAQDRPPEVADPAHDRRRERDQAGLEALEVPDRRLVEGVDQPGRAGHQPAEQEGERDRGVDVDPH